MTPTAVPAPPILEGRRQHGACGAGAGSSGATLELHPATLTGSEDLIPDNSPSPPFWTPGTRKSRAGRGGWLRASVLSLGGRTGGPHISTKQVTNTNSTVTSGPERGSPSPRVTQQAWPGLVTVWPDRGPILWAADVGELKEQVTRGRCCQELGWTDSKMAPEAPAS